MPSWWPFSGNASTTNATIGYSNGTVPTIGGAADTEAFRKSNDGTIEGNTDNTRGIGTHQTEGYLERRKAADKRDLRAIAIDTDSIDCLLQRFSSEFKHADDHMKDRKNRKKIIQLYDYDNDDRFQQWKKDQQEVRERLQIHWLDNVIDRPSYSFVYSLRLFTTAGLFYGAGRTVYLYRTMDKVYAKLNGVTLGRIAFSEITMSVAKSGALAIIAALGLTAGDAVATLATVLITGDVARPERHWGNVVASFTTAGLFAGITFSAMHMSVLSPWGMKMATLGYIGAGGVVGVLLGYFVYRPFAATRQHALYDPFWRPWNLRVRRDEGPSLIRGKYM